jgi:hypothetical protein
MRPSQHLTFFCIASPPLAAGLIGLIGYAAANNPAADMADGEAAAAESAEAAAAAPLPRENAVLVFGASGKLGRKVVDKVGKTCSLVWLACLESLCCFVVSAWWD